MNKELKTRRFFEHQIIELRSNCVHVKSKSLFDYNEFDIPFEELENRKSITIQVNHGFIVLALLFFIISLMYLSGGHWGLFSLLALISFIITLITFSAKKRIILIKGYQNNLQIFFSKASETEVRKFADLIIDSSNTFFLEKYSKVDRDLPLEGQLNNLIFLKERQIISEDKFQELKCQLLGKENRKIGYN